MCAKMCEGRELPEATGVGVVDGSRDSSLATIAETVIEDCARTFPECVSVGR